MTLTKAQMREAALARRRELATLHPAAAQSVATRLVDLLGVLVRVRTVAGYMTLGDELDCRPALAALHGAGAALALPVAAKTPDEGLAFRAWRPGDALVAGPFGTQNPLPSAAVVEPDIVLVPLVAFDSSGHRLGYGAGFYDRVLDSFRARKAIVAIGLAYDGQEIAPIPVNAHDQRLDAVVTETRVLEWGALR